MIQFGVRWSTVTRAADFATSGTACTALAAEPMTATTTADVAMRVG